MQNDKIRRDNVDISRLQKRNPSMDILRIVAAFSVLSVHFFLHNGFYSQIVEGTPMFVAVLMRTLFGVCVPLFMILTGYLMCQKTLSKDYYKGIRKTLIIFVLATIACMIYKAIKYGDEFSFISLLFGTLDFTGANYSWYIEMYIGLFLIAPFLNLAYNKLDSQKKKQILVITFIAITILPSLLNIFNFDNASWWTNPVSNDEYRKIVPNWWTGFYPVTYYFVGCYLREFGLKIKTPALIATFLSFLFVFSGFSYFRSSGSTFKSSAYVYWNGFMPFILSVLLFVMISRIKTDKLGTKSRFVLWKLSDAALGIYLISYIFDELVYGVLNANVPVMTDRLPYYFITVPIVFILSALSSFLFNILTKFILLGWSKLVEFIKLQKEKNNREFWQDVLFIALFSGGLIFSVWKVFYGFGGNDEAFYLTIPDRLIRGDALIVDEWHLSQLSGVLLVPFVWLYKLIVGSCEGIILTARFAYVIFHGIISYVVYSRLRKYGIFSAIAASFFFIYTPYNIMALSYNTIGLDLVVLCGVLMGTASFKKKAPVIISGIAFAGAVLCNPYLTAAYVMYIICVIVHHIIKKKNFKFILSSNLFEIKTFLWFTAGVAGLAIVFIAFVLPRTGINGIIENLPYLLTDPEHPQLTLSYRFNLYFKSIVNFHEQFSICLKAYALLLIVMLFDKKRRTRRGLYLIISCAAAIYTYVLIVPNLTTTCYNTAAFPILFIGLTSYFLIENKPKNLFASMFILGFIYSMAMSFSSNQYFYVIAMALTASSLAGLVFLNQLIKEMKESPDILDYPQTIKISAATGVVLAIVLMCGFQVTIKANHCFWESGIETLTSKISCGPAKGIFTTVSNKANYEAVYNDVISYRDKEKDNILFLTNRTWCYLTTDMPYGTLSAWVSGETQTSLDRLKTYYQVNPKKTPEYIYVPKDAAWPAGTAQQIAGEFGYNISDEKISWKLTRKQ